MISWKLRRVKLLTVCKLPRRLFGGGTNLKTPYKLLYIFPTLLSYICGNFTDFNPINRPGGVSGPPSSYERRYRGNAIEPKSNCQKKKKRKKEIIGASQNGVCIHSTTINGGKGTNKKSNKNKIATNKNVSHFFRVCMHASISAAVIRPFLCKRHRKNSLFLNTTNTILAKGKWLVFVNSWHTVASLRFLYWR